MKPKLTGIDHVHITVPNREVAAEWFRDALGFHVEESLRIWAADGGPLTIGNADGSIHLALFARDEFTPSSAVAFGADAQNFLAWKQFLETRGMLSRCTDHKLAWSLYFCDPWANSYEITCYEHAAIAAQMTS